MKNFYVWAVCKDVGGMNNILPIVRELIKSGVSTLFIANGKSAEMLKGKAEFVVYNNAEAVMAENQPPKVLITSMCSGGGVGRDLVPLLRGKAKIIAVQDFWGARLWTDWAAPEFRPDFICVNDDVGRKIILGAWPEYSDDRIVITGYPAFDAFAGFDQAAAATKARLLLNLPDKPVVLFGGQLKGSGQALAELVAALNIVRRDVCLIPRIHPRMKDNAPEEAAVWERALADFRSGDIIADSSACDPQSLVAASDVVVSMFSAMLVEAAVLRKPAIALLHPNVGMKAWLDETGGGMKDFPLAELGCCAKATNRDQLVSYLKDGLGGWLDLRPAQERHFAADGRNAGRIVNFIRGLIR